MVKAPVETVLAMALPEIEPKSPLAITETFRVTGFMTYRSQWEVNEKTLGPAFFQKRAKEDEE